MKRPSTKFVSVVECVWRWLGGGKPMKDKLLDAYIKYVSALPEEERHLKIAVLPHGVFTPLELVDHMSKGDPIGREARRSFLDETLENLKEAGQSLTGEKLEEATATVFLEAANTHSRMKRDEQTQEAGGGWSQSAER
jgi:hypothetical protein